jgi:hypothetical protein
VLNSYAISMIALSRLKQVRPKVEPNRHFCEELRKYETKLFASQSRALAVSQEQLPTSAPTSPNRVGIITHVRKRSRSAPSDVSWEPPIVPSTPEVTDAVTIESGLNDLPVIEVIAD